MRIVNEYVKAMETIDRSIDKKRLYITKILSFLLAVFLVTPIVVIDANLLALYYDLERTLIIILGICFVGIVMLYTRFYSNTLKCQNKYIYLVNLLYSFVLATIVVTIVLIMRR